MLEAMCELMKFAQSHDTFACDFVVASKMYSVYLSRLYFDPKRIYNDEWFKSFINLVDYNNDGLMSTWCSHKHLVCSCLLRRPAI